MRHRTLPCLALMLATGITVGGCASATASATAGTASHAASASASATASATAAGARAKAPVIGPPGPDPACATALKAEQTLQTRQGTDQASESALDQDFTNFANALSAAAQHETRPGAAKAMTALASDYNDLVASQSGAVDLPSMSTVENDGTAFQKACA